MKCEDIIMQENGRVVGREIVDASFDEWIAYLFDRPTASQHWCWNEDSVDWSVPASKTVAFISQTFEQSGALLKQFNDDQVANGLNFISNLSLSEVAQTFRDESIPWAVRKRTINSICKLYSECFAVRCSSTLSHLLKPGSEGNALNGVCYMWWDVFPINGQSDKDEHSKIDQECLAVMEFALDLDSDACRESALHGLGHWVDEYPDHVHAVIDRFIEAAPDANPKLIRYARTAREANVL